MLHVATNLVRVFRARLAVDPAQQRLQPALVVGIDEEVDDLRHASLRFAQVAIDRIPVRLIVRACRIATE